MPSLGPSPLGPMSTMSWLDAAQRVSRVVGGRSDPDTLSAARDFIRETLQDWDVRRDWRYLHTIADDISVTAGSATADLPAPFKKPYLAYVNGLNALAYIERFEWDKVVSGVNAASTPCYYSLYNQESRGKIELWPPSSIAATLKVLYIRSPLFEGSDDEAIDIPARWEGYILAGARYRLVGSKEGSEKAEFWKREYEGGVVKAVGDDNRIPDQFQGFRPIRSLVAGAWNLNSVWPYWNE